jgi:hypothetical protein
VKYYVVLVSALLSVLTLTVPARADDLCANLLGSYSTTEQNFVTLKRLSFVKQKDGSIRVQGTLVGFPDEVPIGEATPEPYADRQDKEHSKVILASFANERYKPLVIITPGMGPVAHPPMISFTCYMKDTDGARIRISGFLRRDAD